jgi:hypothetical protein
MIESCLWSCWLWSFCLCRGLIHRCWRWQRSVIMQFWEKAHMALDRAAIMESG